MSLGNYYNCYVADSVGQNEQEMGATVRSVPISFIGLPIALSVFWAYVQPCVVPR